ncbi:MAG TPA: hypothetical protein VKJ45_10210, partial [Blastocatellia bacterium]|nr:hypothetical protein [Blastocatellia bacterium]
MSQGRTTAVRHKHARQNSRSTDYTAPHSEALIRHIPRWRPTDLLGAAAILICIAVIAITASAGKASGQTPGHTGIVEGTVTDAEGAAVAG